MRMVTRGWMMVVLGSALLGCAGDAEDTTGDEVMEDAAVTSPDDITYAPELDVNIGEMTRTETGLYYEDRTVGQGPTAQPGVPVAVHYTGWLPDGTQFDSSRDRGEPFVFLLGAGDVIDGWDEGVAGMNVGGRRTLVIPPDLAYGAEGAGGAIPPSATLVFDVELLEIQ